MDQINDDDNDQQENLLKEGANSTKEVELQIIPSNEEINDQQENLLKDGANSTKEVELQINPSNEEINLEMDQTNDDDNDQKENLLKEGANSPEKVERQMVPSTVKSLSEALLFAEHGENMNNFCTLHVLPRFELEIFIY